MLKTNGSSMPWYTPGTPVRSNQCTPQPAPSHAECNRHHGTLQGPPPPRALSCVLVQVGSWGKLCTCFGCGRVCVHVGPAARVCVHSRHLGRAGVCECRPLVEAVQENRARPAQRGNDATTQGLQQPNDATVATTHRMQRRVDVARHARWGARSGSRSAQRKADHVLTEVERRYGTSALVALRPRVLESTHRWAARARAPAMVAHAKNQSAVKAESTCVHCDYVRSDVSTRRAGPCTAINGKQSLNAADPMAAG